MSLHFVILIGLTALSWTLAASWVVQALTAAFGLRQLPSLLDPAMPSSPSQESSVAVIVPACNEQQTIAACLQSLIDQDWPNLQIVAVDDRSTDRTGAIMENLQSKYPGRLAVLHVTTLPEEWLGKTHAMASAVQHAKSLCRPRWLLFTDGDVLFHPECLRRSLALAELDKADHFVVAPTAIVHTAGEAMMMSFLQVMGLCGARLWRVSDPATRDAVGIGAFNLLRSSAYDQLGGFERLRLQVLEDLALARLVKDAGLRQIVAFAPGYVKIYWAAGIRGVINTMTKNLFAIFQFRLLLMAAASCGLAVACLGPLLGLLWRQTQLPSLLALLAIASLYRTAAHYLTPLRPVNFFAFPLGAMLFIYAVVRSTVVTLRNGGVIWRGTLYPLSDLRAVVMKVR